MRIGISAPLGAPGLEDADVRSVGIDVVNALCFSQRVLGTDYDLIISDNQNSCARVAEIAAEFEAAGVEAVLGLPTSDEVHRSAALLARAGIPAITSMATSPKLAGYPYVFRTRTNDRHACQGLLEHIRESGYLRIGVLSEDTAYARDCAEELWKLGKEAGIDFVWGCFPTHSRALDNHISALCGAQVEAVFISTQDEEGFDRVLRQVRRHLGGVAVLGASMPGSRKFIEMAQELAAGIVYASEPPPQEWLTPYGLEFLHKFRREYGEPQTGVCAVALSFAAFFAFHCAICAGGDIQANLRRLEFPDPVNGAFRFEQNEITSALKPQQENRFAARHIRVNSNL